MKGIVIVGHGSRSEEAREEFWGIVEGFRRETGMEAEGCFMEISRPFIPETIQRMYSVGIRDITVVPCFLFSGIHISEDIPYILASEKSKYAELMVSMAQPIGCHGSIVDILKERAGGRLSCI